MLSAPVTLNVPGIVVKKVLGSKVPADTVKFPDEVPVVAKVKAFPSFQIPPEPEKVSGRFMLNPVPTVIVFVPEVGPGPKVITVALSAGMVNPVGIVKLPFIVAGNCGRVPESNPV